MLTACIISTLIVSTLYLYDYLTTADWLAVDEVQFDGVYRIDQSELDRLLEDVHGQNIMLLSLDQYIQRLENHPRVQGVSFRRILPNRLVCVVEEREPVALLFCGRFLEVDRHGMILGGDALTRRLDLPIITGISGDAVKIGKICRDNRLEDVLSTLEICKRLGGRFAEEISELKISSGGISIISLKNNSTLLLGDTDYRNRLEKYFVLKNSIAEEGRSAKLIDLRFKDQVVLRNKL